MVQSKKSSDDRLQLAHDNLALDVRFSALGKGRRVTLHEAGDGDDAKTRAALGLGGVDLVPAAGSPAAQREQWIRDHPRLHTLRATLGGVAGIVVPLLLFWLLARFAFSIDLPDLPLPDLPDINLPDIPLPDVNWPDWSLPGWVREVRDVLKFVFPVVLAFVLARAEIRRRRTQDELRDKDASQD